MTVGLTKDFTETEPVADPGPPAPIRIAWAPVPRVNLLPMEILEGRRFRRTQAVLGATVVGVLLLAGAGTYWAQSDVAEANDQLVVSQAKVTALQTEQTRFAAVPLVIAQVEAAGTARENAMGYDVLWSGYLNDLDSARPDGVGLTGLTITMNIGPTATGTDPLNQPGVGVLTIDGVADQYKQVSSWMDNLNKINGTRSSSLNTATKNEGKILYTSGAVISSDALSHRYDKKAG